LSFLSSGQSIFRLIISSTDGTLRLSKICLTAFVTLLCGYVLANEDTTGHLRLVDHLDRPEDGYCLDVVGSGRHIRFDLPLTAHNCKPGLYPDEAVLIENRRIRFPAYGACATVQV